MDAANLGEEQDARHGRAGGGGLAWVHQCAGNFLGMEPAAGEICAVLCQAGEQGVIAAGASFDLAFGAIQCGHLCQGHAEQNPILMPQLRLPEASRRATVSVSCSATGAATKEN